MGNYFKKFRLSQVLWALIAIVNLTPSFGFAQDISIEAEVSSKTVTLGSAIRFTITVNGESNIAPIQFPAMEGFNVEYLGPTTRMSFVNGQKSSSKSFAYSLFPLKEGQFEIPTINVVVSGRTYTLRPIPIEVGTGGTPAGSSPPDKSATIQDKLFVVLKVPKNTVYINEPMPIKIMLFDSGPFTRNVNMPEMNNIGFTMEEYQKPQQYQQVINGVRHQIVEFNNTIYPTREGELRLGPVKLNCNIVVTDANSNSRLGPGGSAFNDDFFNSFFNRQTTRLMVLESESVAINVLPLPAEGRPVDFSGAVGQYDFNVSVSPDRVKVGDPITLRMTVIGKGNLSVTEMPKFPLDAEFKLYDPQIFEKDNIKKMDQVLIPQSENIKEVPALQFSYFDPQLKKYRTLTKGPFPIEVLKLEEGEEFKVVGLEGGSWNIIPEVLGEDIVFIKMNPGKLHLKGEFIYNSRMLYALISLIILAWAGIFMYLKRTHRIKTDIVYARRLQAPRQAKQRLERAQKLIVSGRKKEFYDALFKTAQSYLGNKLHLSSGAVTFETAQSFLKTRNIEEKVITDIKAIFEECDMIRYASAEIDKERMQKSYQLLAQSIDYLERYLK